MSHDHEHASASRGRLIAALAITATILIAEVVGAVVTGSLALLVDAGHMLTDTAGLAIAVTAASLVGRAASSRRTFGFARAEVLGAVAQAAILLIVGVIVIVEAIQRFSAPPELPGGALVIFGVIGLLGNVASLLVLASGRASSMNVRAAFLEVANDAIGSIAVIVAAIVILTTGFQLADVIAALAIGVLILPRAVLLLRDAAAVLLESTPSDLDLDSVRSHLLEVEHVQAVHDLHVSQIATGLPVLTAHVVVDDECFYDGHAPRILDELQECVAEHFPVQIEHSTFQLELAAHSEHEHPTHD